MTACVSRATRSPSCATPEPPRVTWSRSAVPLACTTPLPESVTVTDRACTPWAETIPLPLSTSAPSDGTVTATRIGVRGQKLPVGDRQAPEAHARGDVREQVVVAAHDHRPRAADGDDVRADELDAAEGGHDTRLLTGHAGPARRLAGVLERDEEHDAGTEHDAEHQPREPGRSHVPAVDWHRGRQSRQLQSETRQASPDSRQAASVAPTCSSCRELRVPPSREPRLTRATGPAHLPIQEPASARYPSARSGASRARRRSAAARVRGRCIVRCHGRDAICAQSSAA